MELSLIFFPILALALGFKHAYDADHLIAVSNFLTRSKNIAETSRMTVSWALGHMATAAIITVILFTIATAVESMMGILGQLELAVAFMLIGIGAVSIIFGTPVTHEHSHTHGDSAHSHTHTHRYGGLGILGKKVHFHHQLFGVGIVHGLASNDELIAIFVAGLGVGSLQMLLGGVAIFTVGVMLGMTLFGIALTYPILKYGIKRIQFAVNMVTGSLSILYGLMMIAGLGFNPFDLVLG
jgi:high-affinity nickel permease